MCILALADDMTGALEVGAKFNGAGISALVFSKPAAATSAPVVVFDTESRHLSPERAAAEVQRFLRQSGVAVPRLVYKKTDSTLRGNISAELCALSELFPAWRIGYAPAYPAMGRTVKGGVLYVHGLPVDRTAFAQDILNPIHASSVSAILHPSLPCAIFDGETDAHLRQAAASILADDAMRIAAGPAALAEMLAERLDLPRSSPGPLPSVQTCLILNGSLHECSAMQLRDWGSPGWRIVRKEYPSGLPPHRVAAENARYLAGQIARENPDAVLVIGGDTAFALVAELGLPPLQPIAEVVPGVPVTRIDAADARPLLPARRRDLLLITKAGGFGDPDTLRSVRCKLETHAK